MQELTKAINSHIEECYSINTADLHAAGKAWARKVRNIWHRTLTCNLISKYCKCLGIKKIEINPVYNSFIGNIQNSFFDPVSASIEICRRGMNKFVKGASFFPKITKSDYDTMKRLMIKSRDVHDRTKLLGRLETYKSWRSLYNLFNIDGCKVKYRRSLDKNIERLRLFSSKSRVVQYKLETC